MTNAETMAQLKDRSAQVSIRVALHNARKELGLEPERSVGQPRKAFAYVRLSEATDAFLRAEAVERGTTTCDLAMRILDKVAADALVDAVLDDGGGR